MEPTDRMQQIGRTLLDIVEPDMTPKQLMKAARKHHPKASKKEIAQAAFFIVIASAHSEPQKAKSLHGFAIDARR
jgi:hypothetical protein